MTHMIWLTAFCLLAVTAIAEPVGTFTFVESVPVETDLDLPDLPDASEVWLDVVRGATRALDIFSFYVSPDPAGEGPLKTILDAVEARARDGVAGLTLGFVVLTASR